MTIITTNTQVPSTYQRAVQRALSGYPLSDANALAVAAAWQSPGAVGCGFAELASTGSVSAGLLEADIDLTFITYEIDAEDQQVLDALTSWALNRSRAVAAAGERTSKRTSPTITRTCK